MFFSSRLAIGYLFSDFSFLSIYLASGLLIIILTNKRYYLHYYFPVIFIACIITSARTGIVALAIIYVVILIIKSLKHLTSNPLKYFFSLLITPAILLFLLFIIKQFRPNDFNLSSGRFESYISSFHLLKENWALGLGLGVGSYSINTGQVIPHNIFIQFLVQTGVLGVTFLIIILSLITINIYQSNRRYLWIWFLILLGAQFIPDIFHSRFIIVVAIILLSNNTSTIKGKDD
ncbi:O-antigen ligase family protein [Psychrobacillus psychrodurans]|uniref:O-antigen ligase family protein n=1 Tax=Psychrobacillus psychrodurans TaxID=126157 RepID=UPI001F4D7029|nr:O-antigen ligase family protein [Psychrobacillus psychrodurans]MCK1998546.1 O-antigen ligase family protein [Psychrobacillus psychrodurans]